MRKTVYAGLAVLAVACGVGAAATHEAQPASEPMLKVVDADGAHGSGFHIGHGYVMTAAHVVKERAEVAVEAAEGQKDSAEVLWVNLKHDVALLKLKTLRVKAATLSCTVPTPGSQVEARGNPNNLTFVSTWGRVAGKPLAVDPWAAVVPLNVTIVPGQSGGPLYNTDGEVVGMAIGIMLSPVGFVESLVGIGYAVPGSTLCELLAKV